MKKYLMMAALAAATISLTSCFDEEQTGAGRNVGDPICFTATLNTENVKTRTVYGDKAGTAWPIYWIEGDQVYVNSPEANTQGDNANAVAFEVVSKLTKDSAKVKYDITTQEGGLHWGPYNLHHFFEAYPAGYVEGIESTAGSDEAVLTATLPATQSLTKQPDGSYADMNCALMAGKTTANRIGTTAIDLPFSPINTAVDLTILPSSNTDMWVKSITLANIESETSPAPLAGVFTYNFKTGTYDSKSAATDQYNIQLEFEEPIKLTKATTTPLKVTAFVRGDFDKELKVVLNVTMLNSETTEVTNGTLKKELASGKTLLAGARNQINLGALPTGSFQPMTGEWWVSHMTNRAYVSQLSMPGVYDATNFIHKTTGDDRAQTALYGYKVTYGWFNSQDSIKPYPKYESESIGKYYGQMAEYLNHGNRVFDFKPSYSDGAWVTDRIANWNEKPEKTDFHKIVKAADDWLKVHTTEFLIFIVSDYDFSIENGVTKSSDGYHNNLRSLLESIIPESRRLYSFNPDITVEEARGKILIINASPCDNPMGISVTNWHFNTSPRLTSSTSVTDGRTTANECVSHTYAMGTGSIVVHDYNNAKHTTSIYTTTRYDWTNKQTWTKANITAAAESNDPNTWYVTSAAYRYNAITSDLTYGDAADVMRPLVKTWVQDLSNGDTYQKTGIILSAYAGTENEGSIASNGDRTPSTSSLEYIIWENNYKADGPLKAPTVTTHSED